MRVNYAIVIVSDMKRAVAFYRDAIGLTLKFESPEWTEFLTEGATLAIHLSRGPKAAEDPALSPAGRCRPGFSVSDLDAFHARMVAHGVRCIAPPHEVFGARLAHYADPDGLMFSVAGA